MFYLTMHSTHFYLRLYGVRHMVKDNSDSEKGNLLPPHRLLLSINSKGSFICTIPDRITHTTAFVTPVVEHWLEREIAQWVHPMKDRSDDPPTMSERSTSELRPALCALTTELHSSVTANFEVSVVPGFDTDTDDVTSGSCCINSCTAASARCFMSSTLSSNEQRSSSRVCFLAFSISRIFALICCIVLEALICSLFNPFQSSTVIN